VALKNEVRLESRQVKTALDEFRAVFETLQTSQTQLGGELDRARNAVAEQRRAALKPVLLELVELHDRHGSRPARPAKLSAHAVGRLCRREQALRQAVAQGQDISLRRLEQILGTQQVSRSGRLGSTARPAHHARRRTGSAAGSGQRHRHRGTAQGLSLAGRIAALAEVKVNRRPEPDAAAGDAPLATEPSPN
jgi:molecular chaperone GrpE